MIYQVTRNNQTVYVNAEHSDVERLLGPSDELLQIQFGQSAPVLNLKQFRKWLEEE